MEQVKEIERVTPVRREEISEIDLGNGSVCYLIQEGLDFGDNLGLYDHIEYDIYFNEVRSSKKTVLDSEFNKFEAMVGPNIKPVEKLMADYEAKGKRVFIGQGSPLVKNKACFMTINKCRTAQKAIWSRPTEEEIAHYQSLLNKNNVKKLTK